MLRALGPWTGPDIDKDYAGNTCWRPGDVIEGQVFHNTNDAAGTIVLVVVGTGPTERTLECRLCHAKMITTGGTSLSRVTF